jgi:GlpG protein
MRSIGCIEEESHARVFSYYLYSNGIENQIEAGEDGGFDIWVHSEDQIDRSKDYLDRFKEYPGDPEYTRAYREAIRRMKEEHQRAAKSRTRYIDVRTTWNQAMARGITPITLALIVISAGVFLLLATKLDEKILETLLISKFVRVDPGAPWYDGLPEILEGQVWRLFTPMFLHFGIIHLLFNMLWLKDLGSAIERRNGQARFLVMVLSISLLSNLGQYLTTGPVFGGMSGVVYGLLGYIWMRGKFDPSSGFHLPKYIVVMMVGWFFICLVGLIPQVANTAHAVGLGLGMAWGFIVSGQIGRYLNRSG